MRELEIEANFTVTVAHLKYRDKTVLNKERKRQQILNEFMQGVVTYYLGKQQLTNDQMQAAIEKDFGLKS